MATYTKQLLSGATNGKQIKVSAASTLGTPLIHAAVAGTADLDEIWLWAHNSGTASVKLTLECGAAAAPDDNIEIPMASEAGYTLIVPGLLLNNSTSIRAFAASVNLIMINGYVNRITA